MESVGLSVDGSENLFPVARVFCIGRNYAGHVIEMGGNPEREEPFSFGKPATATVPNGGPLGYPPTTGDLHHEVELVIALGKGCRDIPVHAAGDCIFGHAVGALLSTILLNAALPQRISSVLVRPRTWLRS